MTESEVLAIFEDYSWLMKERRFVLDQIEQAPDDSTAKILADCVLHLSEQASKTERLLSFLTNARARLLLRLRFIDGLTLEQTAERMGLSYQ